VQANAEAFLTDISRRYFRSVTGKHVTIYLSKDQSETFKLLRKHGHKSKTNRSSYVVKTNAIYTHLLLRSGSRIDEIGTLFHEIVHHLVCSNYKNPPIWFNEGLATFLGNENRILNGKVVLGNPDIRRAKELKDRIGKGVKPNLKRLLPMTQKQLYNWPIGYNFSRALFYWLYETGELEDYLQNARKEGFEVLVLEQTVGKKVNEINRELLDFIREYCYAGAYVYEGVRIRDSAQKKELFNKALSLRAHYGTAKSELAFCYYREKDYNQSKKYLKQILMGPESIEYPTAAKQLGHCYYMEKDYPEALKYYEKSLEYSEYHQRKYELYYHIANCYHYLKNYETAKKFHEDFLENCWEPERFTDETAYSKRYLGREDEKIE
jgi:tetratricopeptide (TPR) repeat protein